MRLCEVIDCGEKHYARTMCLKHYRQARAVKTTVKAEDWFTQHFPANGGYFEDDGFLYRNCRRCGIGMEIVLRTGIGVDKTEGREFCDDCRYPEFIQYFIVGDRKAVAV